MEEREESKIAWNLFMCEAREQQKPECNCWGMCLAIGGGCHCGNAFGYWTGM